MHDEPAKRALSQRIGLWAGPILAAWPLLALAVAKDLQHDPALNRMAAVVLLMAVWWITEAIPLAATALLPLVLLPLLGLASADTVAASYGDSMIFLFLGGFLIALAIEDSGLHRRVALWIIAVVGSDLRRMVLGFMVATAALSMWLSNTATTMMLLPIALSVCKEIERQAEDERANSEFGTVLMLGLAYGASIGGVATLIGTPPNALFASLFGEFFPEAPPVEFFNWMKLALPFSLVMLVLAWWVLTSVLYRLGNRSLPAGRNVVRQQLRDLGPMRSAEWRMAAIFLTTATLWILRKPVNGFGWIYLLGLKQPEKLIDDSTVAMLMALVCFVSPANGASGRRLLCWESTLRLPWGVLLLFGGGLALAAGMTASKLDLFLAERLASAIEGMSAVEMTALTTAAMTFFTELTSNLASVNIALPLLAGTSKHLGLDPRLLMVPATLAASCAFMLPVATPPNAIVYGSGRLTIGAMLRAGLVMNLISICVIVAMVLLLR